MSYKVKIFIFMAFIIIIKAIGIFFYYKGWMEDVDYREKKYQEKQPKTERAFGPGIIMILIMPFILGDIFNLVVWDFIYTIILLKNSKNNICIAIISSINTIFISLILLFLVFPFDMPTEIRNNLIISSSILLSSSIFQVILIFIIRRTVEDLRKKNEILIPQNPQIFPPNKLIA